MRLCDDLSSVWTYPEELIELISAGARDNASATTLAHQAWTWSRDYTHYYTLYYYSSALWLFTLFEKVRGWWSMYIITFEYP